MITNNLELNNTDNIINNYFTFLNKKNHNENHSEEYYKILNIIKNNNNDIINYLYNINIDLYIDFCKIHGINNISNIFKKVSNIKILNKDIGTSNSAMLKCLYNNKPSIIKIFFNPFINLNINYSLFYEQLVNLKIKKYQENSNDPDSKFYLPEIYEVGYIELDYLFDKNFKIELNNLLMELIDNQLESNINFKSYIKEIINNLINNNTDNLNESSYKFRIFKKYVNSNCNFWIQLLLFFLNIKNKFIHISIVEDLTQYNNITDITEYYSKNNYNISKNNTVNFNNDFFIILYQIFSGIYLLNDKLEIIHNDIHFENIIIIENYFENKFRCVIIDYNLSYINNNIYNIGLIKRYNLGVKNIYNRTYDVYLFITYIGTICNYKLIKTNEICNYLPDTYNNIYTYNHNNYKYLTKIFFKKNQILKDLVFEHIILYFNNIIKVPINYYDYPHDICSASNIINNKYFIKKLKKINYI